MKAYNDCGVYADTMDTAVARDRRSPFAMAQSGMQEMHNGRGLVIAVLLSAACWGVIALAFLA